MEGYFRTWKKHGDRVHGDMGVGAVEHVALWDGVTFLAAQHTSLRGLSTHSYRGCKSSSLKARSKPDSLYVVKIVACATAAL